MLEGVLWIWIISRKLSNNNFKQFLPKPKCAFTPPKFLTRNSPAFLKLQFIEKPKSDSRTQVHWIWLIVPTKEMGKTFIRKNFDHRCRKHQKSEQHITMPCGHHNKNS